MNRVMMYVLLVVASGVMGAGIAAFGDYYDVLFGHSSGSTYRRSWDVVENDTTARIKTRAKWGAAGGTGLGLVAVVWVAVKRRGGKEEEREE